MQKNAATTDGSDVSGKLTRRSRSSGQAIAEEEDGGGHSWVRDEQMSPKPPPVQAARSVSFAALVVASASSENGVETTPAVEREGGGISEVSTKDR